MGLSLLWGLLGREIRILGLEGGEGRRSLALNLDSSRRFAISAREGRDIGRRRVGGFLVDVGPVGSVSTSTSIGGSVLSSTSSGAASGANSCSSFPLLRSTSSSIFSTLPVLLSNSSLGASTGLCWFGADKVSASSSSVSVLGAGTSARGAAGGAVG